MAIGLDALAGDGFGSVLYGRWQFVGRPETKEAAIAAAAGGDQPGALGVELHGIDDATMALKAEGAARLCFAPVPNLDIRGTTEAINVADLTNPADGEQIAIG